MSSSGRRAGIAGAVVGLAAAGAATAVAVERTAIGRARRRTGPAQLSSGRRLSGVVPAEELTVRADGGVELHVVVEGRPNAELTVVLVHGYCLDMGTWHRVHRELTGGRSKIRVVRYDQRGHGRSTSGPPELNTIDQLGRDLAAVLAAAAPTGPLVLVGHSMGGMTMMALAQQAPELVRSRVAGIGLVSTSAGGLDIVPFGLGKVGARLRLPVVPVISTSLRSGAAVFEQTRRLGGDLGWWLTRRYGFGSSDVDGELVDFADAMIARTSIRTVAAFLTTLSEHDRRSALATFGDIDVLVIVGAKDAMTPPSHSRELAEELPDAEFVVVPGTGHLLPLERPDVLVGHLRTLIRQAALSVGLTA